MNAKEFGDKFYALLNAAAASGEMNLGEIVAIVEIAKINIVNEQVLAARSVAAMKAAQQMSAESPKIITPN